uniref:Uncharacterized protein n=1 Tax=Anguilla anguilla TaxID=7936 RepID=A0A0E9XZS7_ANGAN
MYNMADFAFGITFYRSA